MRYDAVNRHAYYLLIVWIISDLERVGAQHLHCRQVRVVGQREQPIGARGPSNRLLIALPLHLVVNLFDLLVASVGTRSATPDLHPFGRIDFIKRHRQVLCHPLGGFLQRRLDLFAGLQRALIRAGYDLL
ncbi:MAG: hypothetical protein N838_08580 [Thiohalocapsa sp. PB-PSB1]|jgi:hypothetical protein|nr:MAG: hypothetical protein N838_08580 [Thiohalocapsa sp. PB-PSB1]